MHTSLHLSGHTKNSINARSVALAKVSAENTFKCDGKCTLAILRGSETHSFRLKHLV